LDLPGNERLIFSVGNIIAIKGVRVCNQLKQAYFKLTTKKERKKKNISTALLNNHTVARTSSFIYVSSKFFK